jgi:hypothetical protein
MDAVMGAERALLDAIRSWLVGAGLSPAPASIGPIEPGGPGGPGLPAIVLSLETTRRVAGGVGRRSDFVTGALAWQAAIDLAHPLLPGDAAFRLVSDDHKVLTLPHGGLVRRDGTDGALTASDLTVKVKGAAQTVVGHAPAAGEVQADPTIGQLTFGTALPDDGAVEVTYVLGQWEQRLERIDGTLRVDACALTGSDAAALAGAVLETLADDAGRQAVRRLYQLDVASVGSVGAPDPTFGGARRQSLRFAFVFENEINRPESSGGVIHRIPVTTVLQSTDFAG